MYFNTILDQINKNQKSRKRYSCNSSEPFIPSKKPFAPFFMGRWRLQAGCSSSVGAALRVSIPCLRIDYVLRMLVCQKVTLCLSKLSKTAGPAKTPKSMGSVLDCPAKSPQDVSTHTDVERLRQVLQTHQTALPERVWKKKCRGDKVK